MDNNKTGRGLYPSKGGAQPRCQWADLVVETGPNIRERRATQVELGVTALSMRVRCITLDVTPYPSLSSEFLGHLNNGLERARGNGTFEACGR